MKLKSLIIALAAVGIAVSAANAGSTVNPNVPALKGKLNSPPIQSNFQATFNDINNILGKYASATAPTNPTAFQEWADTTTAPTAVFKYWNAGTATWIPFASLNTATGAYASFSTSSGFLRTAPITVSVSGGVVTYGLSTDGNFATVSNQLALAPTAGGNLLANCSGSSAEPVPCSWNSFANQAIGNANGLIPYRTGGIWSTALTGVSGHAIPFLDGTNAWSQLQTIYPGTATLRAALAGALFRTAQLDGTASVIQQDSFGAAGLFTCMRSDGTAAVSTALAANDLICSFSAHGYDGVANSSVAAAFRLYASQGWTSAAHGTYARVATTANGSLSPIDQFGVEQDGGVTAPPTVTGGSKGAGTFNAGVGYYINGNPFNFSNLAGSLAPSQCPNATTSTTGCVEGDNATLGLSSGTISINLAHANTWTATQTLPVNSLTLAEFPTLTSANIWLGNGSGQPAAVAVSGDCTIANTGALTCTKTGGVAFGPFATVASQTANALYKGNGSSAPVASGLSDNGTVVSSSESIDTTSNAHVQEIANAGTTGTTLNKLAKLTGSPGTAVIATTADTTGNVLGIVTGGAGTTGNAQIAITGQASCVFDGAITSGHYVQVSTTTGGDCHDGGATLPTSGQILGIILAATNASPGATPQAVTLFAPGTVGTGASSSGTVTNVGTAGLASGGPITSTGTVTVTAAAKTDQQTGTSNVLAVTPLHQQDHDSAAKAWALCTNSAGTYTLTASYNINGAPCGKASTGVLTLTFSTAFATASYMCFVSIPDRDRRGTVAAQTASAATVNLITTTTGAVLDTTFNMVCFGRQ